MPGLFVLIATCFNRQELLLSRSLLSVYKQTGISPHKVKIVIIDDNDYSNTEIIIGAQDLQHNILKLRNTLELKEQEFETVVIPNSRTKHSSGSGAWNTGIFHAFQLDSESYISILDDDDEYLYGHLSDCVNVIESDPKILGVFQELIWQLPDGNLWNFPIALNDLTMSSFFIGNPGVQGSNMFIKTSLLTSIGGFDESLPSTTDRDLMIRLIDYLGAQDSDLSQKLFVLNNSGVIHHIHNRDRVTSNTTKKHRGLDLFYRKHSWRFSASEIRKSLNRASILFDYHGTE
jgi:hypothetical protein